MSIINPTDCEVHSVIRFLNVKNIYPAEIHCQLVKVYGEGVMNEENMRKWCHLFNGGRTDVHIEARTGRPSVITKDLKDRVDAHIRENSCSLFMSYVSRSGLYKIVTVQRQYRKKGWQLMKK
jgi:hypothetical protein